MIEQLDTKETKNKPDRCTVLTTVPDKSKTITKRTFNKWRENLMPLAQLYANIYDEVEQKTNKELKYLIKYGSELTETNCWWAEYRVFPLIETIANQELKRRKRTKKSL
ncbi:hypothetical protein AAU57_12195 [Nonlabens sp. YIK11]|uniref:hypothetical protein n=1 Tax=Nonlabens sp. YIK11 TaxID=1453349 RepID=UPI0006DD237C|nr:hypothetical protein [Nonlabens sp. YIK11]KQC34007.1 hypothetical protein AAU57_12195 [Nonlabens sp. YIK11]